MSGSAFRHHGGTLRRGLQLERTGILIHARIKRSANRTKQRAGAETG